MTIRQRTEGAGLVRLAGLVGAAGLAAAAGLHVVWASGSTWPCRDADDLADVVIGRAPTTRRREASETSERSETSTVPGAAMTAGVAALLASAGALTAAASGVIPVRGRAAGLARLGSRVASGVLLARGTSGLVVSGLGIGGATERFRRMDLRVYSPLCVALGSAVAVSARRH